MADRAVCIGPPAAAGSYLTIPSVIAAGVTTGCEAVHPGYGFLSENPAFAEACADNDLVFIGPLPDTRARRGDKAQAKAEMREADVPLVPRSAGPVHEAGARRIADDVGYPVLLTAVAGGGGRGMRKVDSPDAIADAYAIASGEAAAALGDGPPFAERVTSP